ncbi:MAG: hypothetical protein V4601_03190 [Pseudomonadota bacterium]
MATDVRTFPSKLRVVLGDIRFLPLSNTGGFATLPFVPLHEGIFMITLLLAHMAFF